MSLDDFATDRQPEASPFDLTTVRVVNAVELLEQVGLRLGWDTESFILNRHRHLSVGHPGCDVDRPAAGRVLARV